MSTLKTANIANLSGTSTSVENVLNGTAKAWVNFNGTGTVAIRASYNVSSITDNGVGDYTVNFTTAMVDANYGVSGTSNLDGTNRGGIVGINSTRTKTTNSLPMSILQGTSTLFDTSEICVSIFR